MNQISKYEEALVNPTGVYDDPHAVVEDASLDLQQKRKVLKNWEAETIHLEESEAEGRVDGENSLLADIKDALTELSSRD